MQRKNHVHRKGQARVPEVPRPVGPGVAQHSWNPRVGPVVRPARCRAAGAETGQPVGQRQAGTRTCRAIGPEKGPPSALLHGGSRRGATGHSRLVGIDVQMCITFKIFSSVIWIPVPFSQSPQHASPTKLGAVQTLCWAPGGQTQAPPSPPPPYLSLLADPGAPVEGH